MWDGPLELFGGDFQNLPPPQERVRGLGIGRKKQTFLEKKKKDLGKPEINMGNRSAIFLLCLLSHLQHFDAVKVITGALWE